ncbi:MAG: SDR family oxidoreductase, partial [Chloroflexota bacterium]
FRAVKHAVPVMRRGGGGVVILIASGAGVRGPSGSLAYGASKGGVHGLALTLEARLAPHGIRVHDVCPGNLDTVLKREAEAEIRRRSGRDAAERVVPSSSRLGDPAGVAALLTLLASDASRYLRGTLFTR